MCNAVNYTTFVFHIVVFPHDHYSHAFVKVDITKESKSTTALTFKLWCNKSTPSNDTVESAKRLIHTHIHFYSAERLDLFVQCVRLNRLSVGFQTHSKSLQFHFISIIHTL